jgi:hypothetical protein
MTSRKRVYPGMVPARRAAQGRGFPLVLGTEGGVESRELGMTSKENEKKRKACS